MREIHIKEVTNVISDLCIKSNIFLPNDVKKILNKYSENNDNKIKNNIVDLLIENYKYAEEKNIPICQDTGLVVVFAKIGQNVKIVGGSLKEAINDGVANGYHNGYLRCSIVTDPLYSRNNTNNNTPAIIYTDVVCGDKIEITVVPKGFGSENMSKIKMMTPTSGEEDVIDFVKETIETAGANACPPVVIGIGIGGDFEYCAYLAKKALCRSIDIRNDDKRYEDLELKILNEVNKLNIYQQGFSSNVTALAVNIEWYPTHIASLPVAVNMGCHATRHLTAII